MYTQGPFGVVIEDILVNEVSRSFLFRGKRSSLRLTRLRKNTVTLSTGHPFPAEAKTDACSRRDWKKSEIGQKVFIRLGRSMISYR